MPARTNIVAAKKAKKSKTPKTARPAKNPKAGKSPKQVKAPAASPVASAVVVPVPAAVSDNKAIYQGFIADVLNAGQFEKTAQYLDDVVLSHNPFPEQAPGREGFEAALRAFRAAFPDLHVKASHLVAE